MNIVLNADTIHIDGDEVATALEVADWSGNSIGNKALVSAAITALRVECEVGRRREEHTRHIEAILASRDATIASRDATIAEMSIEFAPLILDIARRARDCHIVIANVFLPLPAMGQFQLELNTRTNLRPMSGTELRHRGDMNKGVMFAGLNIQGIDNLGWPMVLISGRLLTFDEFHTQLNKALNAPQ